MQRLSRDQGRVTIRAGERAGDQQALGSSVHFHWMRNEDLFPFAEEQRSWSFTYLLTCVDPMPDKLSQTESFIPSHLFSKSYLGAPRSLLTLLSMESPHLHFPFCPTQFLQFISSNTLLNRAGYCAAVCSAVLTKPLCWLCCPMQSFTAAHVFFSFCSTLKRWMDAFPPLTVSFFIHLAKISFSPWCATVLSGELCDILSQLHPDSYCRNDSSGLPTSSGKIILWKIGHFQLYIVSAS